MRRALVGPSSSPSPILPVHHELLLDGFIVSQAAYTAKKMESALHRAAHGLCGRCSTTLRRQLVVGRVAKPWMTPSIQHTRNIHSTVSRQKATPDFTSNSTARDFMSSSAPKSEAAAATIPAEPSALRLNEDELFHPFSSSPVPEFRRRAAFMKQHAFCPHPDHQATKLPTVAAKRDSEEVVTGNTAPAHVDFECPDCGLPVYCSKEHWMDDYEKHLEICDTLKQINEDDHDLRSGRIFHEAILPETQMEEAAINMTNWDTFMYTRQSEAVDSDRSMRQITRLLTYPVTIASVLHELSPYSLQKGERLTVEGLKSFSGKL